MKKLLVIALTLPVFVVVMGGADCGGVNTCTSDDDCTGKTNSAGEDTPYCDSDAQVCVADLGQCTEDLDCRLLNSDSATTEEDCSANSDCGADEVCVETGAGSTVCATTGDAAVCADIDTDAVDVTDAEGGDATVCLAGGTCEDNGGCTFTAE